MNIFGMKPYITGICKFQSQIIILSIILSVSQFAGVFYITKANQLMEDVGGASYKIDNMVVLVRNDDPAETLADAVDYSFGIQTTQDQVNTQLMLKDLEEIFTKPITLNSACKFLERNVERDNACESSP